MQLFGYILLITTVALRAIAYSPHTEHYDSLFRRDATIFKPTLTARDWEDWGDLLVQTLYNRFAPDEHDIIERDTSGLDFDDKLIRRDDNYNDEDILISDLIRRQGNLDIYIAFGKRRTPKEAVHWMIVTVPENSNDATFWHVTGGPTNGKPFKLEVEGGKRLDSNGIVSKEKLSTIPDSDKLKFKAAVQRAALPGPNENCQNFVVNVLQNLEEKRFVPGGTAQKYAAQIEMISPESKTPPSEKTVEAAADGTIKPGTSGGGSPSRAGSPSRDGSPSEKGNHRARRR